MPPTSYQIAIAGLLSIALLGRYFDLRAFAVVAVAAALPDIDAFVELVWTGAHRSLLHNAFLPLAFAVALAFDLYVRDESYIRRRWNSYGERVAWTAVVCLAVAGISVDMFHNGVNVLWPVHDQLYEISGGLRYSTEDGFVFTDLAPEAIGKSSDVHLYTGVDMTPGEDPAGVERVFVFAEDGQQALLTLLGFAAVGWRLWDDGRHDDEEDVEVGV